MRPYHRADNSQLRDVVDPFFLRWTSDAALDHFFGNAIFWAVIQAPRFGFEVELASVDFDLGQQVPLGEGRVNGDVWVDRFGFFPG